MNTEQILEIIKASVKLGLKSITFEKDGTTKLEFYENPSLGSPFMFPITPTLPEKPAENPFKPEEPSKPIDNGTFVIYAAPGIEDSFTFDPTNAQLINYTTEGENKED